MVLNIVLHTVRAISYHRTSSCKLFSRRNTQRSQYIKQYVWKSSICSNNTLLKLLSCVLNYSKSKPNNIDLYSEIETLATGLSAISPGDYFVINIPK